MVTISEAIQQTEEAEESAVAREKQIQQATTRAKKIRVRGTVAEQLRFGAGLKEARVTARQQREQALGQVKVARQELVKFRGQITERKSQITKIQEQRKAEAERVASFNRDLVFAQKAADRGRIPLGASKRVKKLFAQIREGQRPQEEFLSKVRESREQTGLTPIFEKGQLTSFKSDTKTFSLSELPSSALPKLENIGLITVDKTQVTSKGSPSFTTLQLVEAVERGATAGAIGKTVFPVTPKEVAREAFREAIPFGPTIGGVQDTQENQLLPTPTGKFGGISISKADTSLGSFLERKNPVTGSTMFLIEKGRSIFGKSEEEATPRGQKLAGGITGERFSQVLQTALFFTPIGPTLLVASAVGQFTPGGRREAEDIGLGLEQRFDISSKVGETGFLILSTVGGIAGGFGVVKQVGKALGFPKFETKFLALQEPTVTSIGDESLISIKGIADTTRRGLFFNRRSLSAFETVTKVTPEEGIFKFESVTRGAILKPPVKSLDLVTGLEKTTFPSFAEQSLKQIIPTGQVKKLPRQDIFGSLTSGIGQETDLKIARQVGGFTLSKDVEGFRFLGSTKLFQGGRGVQDFDRFISIGKGFQLESGLITSSKIAPFEKTFKLSGEELSRLSKTGRADIFGFTARASETSEGAGTLIQKFGKSGIGKALAKESTKQTLSQTFPVGKLDVISSTIKRTGGGVAGTRRFATQDFSNLPGIVQQGGQARGQFTGTGQFELTSGGLLPPTTKTRTFPLTGLGLTFREVGGFRSALRLDQPQKTSLRNLTSFIQPTAQRTKQGTIQRQAQRTLQVQKQVQRQMFRPPGPGDLTIKPIGGGFGGLVFPFTVKTKRAKKKITKLRKKIKTPLGVSFTASALGITGKFPTPKFEGLGLLPTQLRVLPGRKRRSK